MYMFSFCPKTQRLQRGQSKISGKRKKVEQWRMRMNTSRNNSRTPALTPLTCSNDRHFLPATSDHRNWHRVRFFLLPRRHSSNSAVTSPKASHRFREIAMRKILRTGHDHTWNLGTFKDFSKLFGSHGELRDRWRSRLHPTATWPVTHHVGLSGLLRNLFITFNK